jgi:hypothetical protein
MSKVEFITPTPPLKAKIGDGGLDKAVLDKANKALSSVNIDIEKNINECLKKLKIHITNETLIKQPSAETLENFIFDLLPLKVDSHMSKNKNLSIIATTLLTFVESLPTMNVDAYHIIRAHVNAMDLIVSRNITDTNHNFSHAILSELDDALTRFNKKHLPESGKDTETRTG